MSSSSSQSHFPSTAFAASRLLLLPNTLVVSVLSFLPISGVTTASSINALLFVLTQDDRLWRPLCLRKWKTLLPYLKHRLLAQEEWTKLDSKADVDEEEEQQKEEKQAEKVKPPQSREEDDGPVFAQDGGWKVRYIAGEMDLCRSFISMSELLSHRWKFRFHFGFDDGRHFSYPVYTAQGRVCNSMGEWYNWRWVDRERSITADEPTPYVKRRFITREALRHLVNRPRPYWLRSAGPELPSKKDDTPSPDVESSTAASVTSVSTLPATSALMSPTLPPRRYEPGHPFFALSGLQLKDCSAVRGLQINQYPPRTITRLEDGGWQMLNQYIIMRSVDPDEAEEEEQKEVDDDEDEDDEEDEEPLDGEDMVVDNYGGLPAQRGGLLNVNGFYETWGDVAEDVLEAHELQLYQQHGHFHHDMRE